MTDTLITAHGEVKLPAFFPDATHGAIRATDMLSARAAGTQGLVMNAYHLYNNPGALLVKRLGGLSAFSGWDAPILTDSGGFQLFSLIRENPKYGEIRDNEIVFRSESGKKLIFTPEKCIESQARYGSDIMMTLDVCTHPNDAMDVQERSVEMTIRWARRCRTRFDQLYSGTAQRPKMFAIVQGGGDIRLRQRCADALKEIGFDGYGFGGWPLDVNGDMMYDILEYTAKLMPDGLIKYAMGLGKPEEIVRLNAMGYSLFDCVIPTREARHHRLYVMNPGDCSARGVRRADGKFYKHYYALDDKHCRDASPISATCGCEMCQRHSRAYLHHLIKIGDSQAMRLMTLHNLWFYNDLMRLLRDDT